MRILKIKLIITGLIAFMILLSFIILNNNVVKNVNTKKWINIEYVHCLQKKLPCECEKLIEAYFAIILDTNIQSRFYGVRCMGYKETEFYQWNIKKESDSNYTVIEQNDYVNQVIGSIRLKGDTLFYFDKNKVKSTFISFGKPEINLDSAKSFLDEEYQFQKQNIFLLNKAFFIRNYPRLEIILRVDSLSCDCNKELGGINIISDGSKSWIIEQSMDSVYIFDFVNSSNDKIFPSKIVKELLIKYKW